MSEQAASTKVKRERGMGATAPIRIALVSLLICGIIFPLVVTGLAQTLFPYQANGEIVTLDGRRVGSNLIDNNFTLPIFFHARNNSASGVDPDITLAEANAQIPRIAMATGISAPAIEGIVNSNVEGMYWIFGSPYVNVLRLNIALIKQYPSVYNQSSL